MASTDENAAFGQRLPAAQRSARAKRFSRACRAAACRGSALRTEVGDAVGHVFGHFERRREQAGQLRPPRLGRQRRVGDRQAEEPCEPDRLNGRPDRLDRPAQRLAAHIDAEGCLDLDSLRRIRGRRQRRDSLQPLCETALIADLERELPDLVDEQSGLGLPEERRRARPLDSQRGESALRRIVVAALK